MNIEINFLECFPSLEKITKEKLYLEIKKEKYDLKNLIKTNQSIYLNNIKEEIYLKLLTKENNILGENIFNLSKYKELFLIKTNPIFQWLDFKKEKGRNNPNMSNITINNFFLFEYIRIKIKITPIITLINKKINQNLTYEDNNNKSNNTNKSKQNIKLDNSLNNNINNSHPITSRNNLIKKRFKSKTKKKLILNLFPDIIKYKNNESVTERKYTKQEIISEIFNRDSNINNINNTNNNNENNKNGKILKLNKINNENNFNKLFKEKDINIAKKKLSLFGEQLLLNESDEVLNKNIINNKNISKENMLIIDENNSNKNLLIKKENNNNLIESENYKIFNINNRKKAFLDIENYLRENNNISDIKINKEDKKKNKFSSLKNDFDLSYTQQYINSIKSENIYREFDSFLKKSFLLFNTYSNEMTKLYLENISMSNFIKYSVNKMKILKRKINNLNTLKDKIEFKIKNLELLKDNNITFLEGIKTQKYFQKEIFEKIIITKKNKEISLAHIVQKLINSKLNSLNNNKNNLFLVKQRKNKEINDKTEKSYLTTDYNDEKHKLNKNNTNRKYKSKKFNKTPNKENKNKKLKENYSTKTNNTINNNHILFKTKNINIKKKEKGKDKEKNKEKDKSKDKTNPYSCKISLRISKKNINKTKITENKSKNKK